MVTSAISLDSDDPFSILPTFKSIVSFDSNHGSLNAVNVMLLVNWPAGISIVAPKPTLTILLSYLCATYKDPPLTIAELSSSPVPSPIVWET